MTGAQETSMEAKSAGKLTKTKRVSGSRIRSHSRTGRGCGEKGEVVPGSCRPAHAWAPSCLVI